MRIRNISDSSFDLQGKLIFIWKNQLVLDVLVKLTTHVNLVLRLRISRITPVSLLYVYIVHTETTLPVHIIKQTSAKTVCLFVIVIPNITLGTIFWMAANVVSQFLCRFFQNILGQSMAIKAVMVHTLIEASRHQSLTTYP